MPVFFFTGPPSPQNITVFSITSDQIQVHWTLPVTLLHVGWMFLVCYVDVSNNQKMSAGMTKISRISETRLLQSYSAVIGGLESHRKYRIEVSTVTQLGIESCEQAAVVVQTGKPTVAQTYLFYRQLILVILKKHQFVQTSFTLSFFLIVYLKLQICIILGRMLHFNLHLQ